MDNTVLFRQTYVGYIRVSSQPANKASLGKGFHTGSLDTVQGWIQYTDPVLYPSSQPIIVKRCCEASSEEGMWEIHPIRSWLKQETNEMRLLVASAVAAKSREVAVETECAKQCRDRYIQTA